MSNETEIRPALTASEWEDCETAWPVAALSTTSGGDLTVSSDDPEDQSFVRVPPRYRHAVAALALYKQPYGFTREMVSGLIDLANLVDPDDIEELVANAKDVATRIAALLPPHP